MEVVRFGGFGGDAVDETIGKVKAKHPDAMFIIQQGDSIELRGEDAKDAARLLGMGMETMDDGAARLTLKRSELDSVLHRLVRAGRRVGIIDGSTLPKETQGEGVRYSGRNDTANAERSLAEKERIREREVKNVEVDSTKEKLPRNREEALALIPKGGKLCRNEDQGAMVRVGRKALRHSALHGEEHIYKAFGKIDEIVGNAVKIGETPVAEDEEGKTNSVGIYYTPVNVDGVQYSARLVVKELEHKGRILDDLSLYNVAMHKEITPSNTNVGTSEDGLAYSDGVKSAYKVKDLIHSSQENDRKLLGLGEKDGVLFSSQKKEDTPIFISNARKAVEGIRQEKATPEQWLAMIQKAGGLKSGEDKWLGLSDWLKGQDKKSLTKDEVLEYIRANQVEVEEVRYEEVKENLDELKSNYFSLFNNKYTKADLDERKRLEEEFYETYDADKYDDDYYEYLREEYVIDNFNEDAVFEKAQEAVDSKYPELKGAFVVYPNESIDIADNRILEKYLGYVPVDNPINETRLQYTTDGLENKREIALTVPTIEPWNEGDEVHFGDAGGGRAVAWVRFGETRDADGKRVLVIDEIQSKRHQEGREKGYKDPALEKKVKRMDELEGKMSSTDGLSNEEYTELLQLRTEGVGRASMGMSGMVPDAPFEKNWHEVAMKRMLRYAAEEGYDKVAWTTGEQQAERYGLSDKVDEIRVTGGYDNIFTVIARKDGGILFQKDVEGEKGIADVIGSDMARKAYSNLKEGEEDYLNEEGVVEFTGDNISVGGEGMKGFYDQMLPRFMDKYGKKWGVKTGEVELSGLGDHGLTMHSVDVTDEMKTSVLGGQVMFSSVGVMSEAEASKYKPVGKGVFGDIYDQFKGDAKKAASFLLYKRSGEALGAFHREELGDIDLPWGDHSWGLRHIFEKHIGDGKSFATLEEAIDEVDRIIKNGRRDFENGDKAVYKIGDKEVTIRKNYREKGKKIADKNWVLTAYDETSADSESPVAIHKDLAGLATDNSAANIRKNPESASDGVRFSSREEEERFSSTPMGTLQLDIAYLTAVDKGDEKTVERMVMMAVEKYLEHGHSYSRDDVAKLFGNIIDENYWEYESFGIRFDNRMLVPDEVFPKSHELYQDYMEDENGEQLYPKGKGYYSGYYDAGELDGTSVIYVRDAEDVAEALGEKYVGKYVYLVAGDNRGDGTDEGEVLIGDAKVLSVLSLPDKDFNTMHHKVFTDKSLEPITRDDNGNVIPLSERFDKEKGDIRFSTSEDLDKRFGGRWLSEQTNEDGRHTTQVKNTIKSYEKFGEWVKKDSGGRKVDVLDASSGLGHGTQWMRRQGMKVDDVEPYPSANREKPTFGSYDEINKKYDYIISNAVLNVIPDDWRAALLHDMAGKMKEGGKMVINVRGAESIRNQGKEGVTKITLDDPSEVLVLRPDGSIRAYQKGFTKQELKGWCEKELGDGYSVEIANKDNGGGSYDTAVVVTKNNESTTKGSAPGLGQPTENGAPVAKFNAKVGINSERTKRLDNLSAKMSEKSLGAHQLLHEIAVAFNTELSVENAYRKSTKKSEYYDLGNGISLRISDHQGNAVTFARAKHTSDNYGIVIKLSPSRFKDRQDVDYLEYVYFPDKLNDASRQKEIVTGLRNFIATGDFSLLPKPDRINGSGKFKQEDSRLFSGRGKSAVRETDARFSSTPMGTLHRQQYEESVRRMGARWHEAYVDHMDAYKRLQDTLAGGGKVADSMDAWTAENHMASRVAAKEQLFEAQVWRGVNQSFNKLVGELDGGWKENKRRLEEYIYKKSGLERNRVFKVRDTVQGWRDAKDKLKAKHPDAMFIIQQGDSIELRGEDAEDAARLLGMGTETTDDGAARLTLKRSELDSVLPRLVRAGRRVGIIDGSTLLKETQGEGVRFSGRNAEASAERSLAEKERIREREVKNVEVDSTKEKLPTNRKEALEMVSKMKRPFINKDQDKEIIVSNKAIRHSATQDHDRSDVQCLGVINSIINEAVMIGNESVATDEIGHTHATEIYYCPVRIDGTQYSARLVVKQYENKGYILDEYRLYDLSAKQKKTDTSYTVHGQEDLTPVSASVSAYKVKDLIHSSQENDRKLLGLSEKDGVLFSSQKKEDTPYFISNARKAVEGIRQEKATPEQWLAMIQKAGGLKAGEDKWLGLSDWLKGQAKAKPSLTKKEVLEYIRANQVEVEEVEYSEDANVDNNEKMRQFRSEFDDLMEQGEEETGSIYTSDWADWAFEQMVGEYGDDFRQGFEVSDDRSRYPTLEPRYDYDGSLMGAARYYLNIKEEPIVSTRLQYTTDGLENKREIALTVPTIEPWNEDDQIHFGDAGEGRAVAWVRFGETTDKDGKRVLVIDEIQSKRHQEGRENGYRDPVLEKKMKRMDELTDKMSSTDGISNEEYAELQQLRAEGVGRASMGMSGMIPDAPFEKNWHELAMKRMLRYAAEEGYDKVAWTTGEQQAERYDIGTKIEAIKVGKVYNDVLGKREIVITRPRGYRDRIEMNRDGIIEDGVGEWSAANGKSVEEVFGKELGKKITETTDETEIKGECLRIGGEGMKGFYDLMLPRFMDKYGRKWGVKTQDVALPGLGDNGMTMHSVDVTDAMRESVMGGQVMFSSKKIIDSVKESYVFSGTRAERGGRFYQDSSGTIDLVSIPDDVYAKMGINTMPFRVTDAMAHHTFIRHAEELGLDSEVDAVRYIVGVMRNFDHVRKGDEPNTFIFSIEEGRLSSGERAITLVVPDENGEYLGVKTTGFARLKEIKKFLLNPDGHAAQAAV